MEEKGLTVGGYLRQEREKKGVSLDSVAKVTRITRENLEALEKDDFQAISAPVFVRGFLRSYANYLGLNPQELVSRYDSQTDLLKMPRTPETPQPSGEENPIARYLTLLLILLAAVAISFYYFQRTSLPPSSPAPSPAALAPRPAEGLVAPAPTIQSPPPRAAALDKAILPPSPPAKEKRPAVVTAVEEAPPERGQVLKAAAAEKTWMRVVADGQRTFDVLLQPKETATWTARSRFEITVGNAGGVELSWNGVSQGILGKPGEVIHLTLPRENTALPSPKPVPEKEPSPGGGSPSPRTAPPPPSR